MFLANINIIRPKSTKKLFILHLFYLLFVLVPIIKAEDKPTGVIETINGAIGTIIKQPVYRLDGKLTYGCPSAIYTDSELYDSFTSQANAFIPIVSLLFTVAVYGTKSVFGYITTCIIDDVVLFSSSFVPILAWYTLVKPVWIFSLISAGIDGDQDTSENDVPLMLKGVPLYLVGSFLLIWPLTMIIGAYFHKCYNDSNKIFFDRIKTFIIWAFFFHSLEIVTFSYLEYKFIFTQYIDLMKSQENTIPRIAYMFNFLFLNWFMNACYLFTSFFLVVTYHFPNLENEIFRSSSKPRSYQGFIRKKTFFFAVTLSIAHAFFEYYWFCSPPFFSAIFIAIITTVLSRSIASFFSNKGEIKYIHKHGRDDNVYARIESKDIRKVRRFYIDVNNDGTNLEKYRVLSDRDCTYVYKKESKEAKGLKKRIKQKISKEEKIREFFYVVVDDKTVILISLGKITRKNVLGEIKDLMKKEGEYDPECIKHGCEKTERRRKEIIDESERTKIKIDDYVLVNVLETGFLSYIIYSHRGTRISEGANSNFYIKFKYIITFFIVMCMQCILCALYSLLIHSRDQRYVAAMIVCSLLTVIMLFLLSRTSDDFKCTSNSKKDVGHTV